MPFQPQTVPWPGFRALVLIHGVGSYDAASYTKLLAALEQAVGPVEWQKIAVYTALYDVFNDWMNEKNQLGAGVDALVSRLGTEFDDGDIGNVVAEAAGDIMWPVLSLSARHMLRDAIIAQLQRVVRDGDDKGVHRATQDISIICHSLGCFHTYEALWELAGNAAHGMLPHEDRVQFKSVMMFASPVNLMRSVAGALGNVVPDASGLATLRTEGIQVPAEIEPVFGSTVPSTQKLVSVTGDFDPIGGHLLGTQLDWAYMNMSGAQHSIDDQSFLGITSRSTLRTVLQNALADPNGLPFATSNPHDWVAYVDRNASMVKTCLVG